MAVDITELLTQLDAQTSALILALEGASEEEWDSPTPAERWTVRDQITHLAYFDESVAASILYPCRFRIEADALMADGMDFPDRIAATYSSLPPEETLRWFRDARRRFVDVARTSDPRARLPWFGPDMSLASAVTARLMETWAHGRDVHDALGTSQPIGPELRSIAHLGIATFDFVHRLHGREVPESRPRVELVGPAGELWAWGPDDSAEIVRGSAEDFALVVTQRRHLDDTALVVEGQSTLEWLAIAQAYAGTAGKGRAPRTCSPRGGSR